jgi:hypothetical protein
MKRYGVALFVFAAFFAAGCSTVVTKHFKVIADPPDSIIRVVSGVKLQEQKFSSPAAITVVVPKDPQLAAKSILEVKKDHYQSKTFPLRYIATGDTMIVKLDRLPDILKYKLSYRLVGPVVSEELQFRDKVVAVSFAVNEQSFQLSFKNLSSKDAKILWDRAEYTDVNGQTHRIMHSGIAFQDRNNPIPDQPVKARASIQEAVIPISNVFMSQKKSYEIRPLFPLEGDAAADLKGKAVILFIPVEMDRQIIPYNFKIEITDSVKG